MESENRRNFLKKTAVCAFSAVYAGSLADRRIFAEQKSFPNKVVYRELGSTGFKVSEVSMGVMNTRDTELIQAALDAGMNYLDTAHDYMGGVNEINVGKVLKKNDRDKIFVTTKVPKVNPAEMRNKMELSLKRLNLDYVDLLLLHITDNRDEALNKEWMKTFEKAKKDGLCRFIGVSTHSNMVEVINAAVESKLWEAVLTGYSFLSPKGLTDTIEKARKAGLAMIAMKTQASGKGFSEHKMGNITPNQAALKWVLENKYIDTVIPGFTTFEQLKEDVAVMGMKLSFFDKRALKHTREMCVSDYCIGVAGCTGCLNQCPRGVKMSDINRCLGYYSGYGDLELARENYYRMPVEKRLDVCNDCETCAIKCANKIDIDKNIKKMKKLMA